jgi:alpha-mannosidase
MYAHQNDWKKAKTQWVAEAFNQPLIAFQTSSHEGPLGKSFSFASLNSQDVMIKTIKKAENTNEIVIQVQELMGAKAGNIKLTLPATVISAREINGAEEYIADARVENSQLVFNINPFQPKAFALKIEPSKDKIAASESQPLALDFNLDGVSDDNNRADGSIDDKGLSIPAELYPTEINSEGILFKLGTSSSGSKNLLQCTGQTVNLPQGDFNRVYLLAFALKDSKTVIKVDNTSDTLDIPYFSGFIGQWSGFNRTKDNFSEPFEKAYLKKVPVAWNSTHLHSKDGNKAYEYAYLFKIGVDIPKGSKILYLPNDSNIIVAAISLANDKNAGVRPAQLMIDNLFK